MSLYVRTQRVKKCHKVITGIRPTFANRRQLEKVSENVYQARLKFLLHLFVFWYSTSWKVIEGHGRPRRSRKVMDGLFPSLY